MARARNHRRSFRRETRPGFLVRELCHGFEGEPPRDGVDGWELVEMDSTDDGDVFRYFRPSGREYATVTRVSRYTGHVGVRWSHADAPPGWRI